MFVGRLYPERLNFGMITPIPKIKDANIINQSRLICVLSVIFEIIT
jgi:hypothetical protein